VVIEKCVKYPGGPPLMKVTDVYIYNIYICNANSPTDTSARPGVQQQFYSGVGIFNCYYLSSPPQITRPSGVPLESGRLIYNLKHVS
jgi:hypothetical protein